MKAKEKPALSTSDRTAAIEARIATGDKEMHRLEVESAKAAQRNSEAAKNIAEDPSWKPEDIGSHEERMRQLREDRDGAVQALREVQEEARKEKLARMAAHHERVFDGAKLIFDRKVMAGISAVLEGVEELKAYEQGCVDEGLLEPNETRLRLPFRLLHMLKAVEPLKSNADLAREHAQAVETEKQKAKERAARIEAERREREAAYAKSRGMSHPLVEVGRKMREEIRRATGHVEG